MNSGDDDDLIGSAEACKVLRVDRSTLSRWAASGDLSAAYKLPGRNGAYVFHRATVRELADRRRRDAQRTTAAS